MTLQVEVVSDVVCPWCFIGKRRLEQALALYRAQHPQAAEPQVLFRPYELNPDLPEGGISRRGYYEKKFGPVRMKEIQARIAGIGHEVGIPFALEKIQTQPNTRRMHALIALAAGHGMQPAVKEAFMHAFFIDALDLGRRDNLIKVATGAGLPRAAVEARLDDPQALAAVEADEAEAHRMGVQGVPHFIFNRRLAVSGAQQPEVLLEAMHAAQQAGAAA